MMAERPFVIGLTGNIATGKSEVARFLERFGARLNQSATPLRDWGAYMTDQPIEMAPGGQPLYDPGGHYGYHLLSYSRDMHSGGMNHDNGTVDLFTEDRTLDSTDRVRWARATVHARRLTDGVSYIPFFGHDMVVTERQRLVRIAIAHKAAECSDKDVSTHRLARADADPADERIVSACICPQL